MGTRLRTYALVQLHEFHSRRCCIFLFLNDGFSRLLEALRRLVIMQRGLMCFNCALFAFVPISDEVATDHRVLLAAARARRLSDVGDLDLVLGRLRRHHVRKRGDLVE